MAPSELPSTQPSRVPPDDPGEYWAYKSFDITEPLFLVQFVILLLLASVLFYVQYSDKKNGVHPGETKKKTLLLAVLQMVLQEFQHVFISCGRLANLWRIGGDYIALQNNSTGHLIFGHKENLEWHDPADRILEQWGCNDAILQHPGDALEPADRVKVGIFRLSPNSGTKVLGAFSTIFGLILFIVLLLFAVYLEVIVDEKINQWVEEKKDKCKNEPESIQKWKLMWTLLWTKIVSIIVEWGPILLITSQQSVVLMPLEQLTPTPYCYNIATPPGMDPQTLFRWYIFSICGIPIGIPAAIGGFFLVLWGWAMLTERIERTGGDDDFTVHLMVRLLGIAAIGFGIFLFFSGVLLFLAWFVLGFILGPWVKFSTLWEQNTTVFANFAAPALFLFKSIFDDALGCCMEPPDIAFDDYEEEKRAFDDEFE